MARCPFELGLLGFYVLSLTFPYFFYFFIFPAHMNSNCTVHAHGFTVQRQSALFTGPTTTLFRKKNFKNRSHSTIHLFEIILLRNFQFFDFSKISFIRTDPTYFENLTIDYMLFIFLTHMSNFVIIGYYLLYDE